MSHPLLVAPIGRSLLRLAGPTTAFMVVQIAVVLAEIWLIGRLGSGALAAFALVYPFVVMVMNVSSGGLGGAVAASMARALGGGRREDAQALVIHSLLLALVFAALCTLFAWTAAPLLYRMMGGEGAVLQQARAYSDLWFSLGVLVWATNFTSAILRGVGNTVLAARFGVVGSAVYVPLSALLGLGVGGWPGWGLAGFAAAGVAASAVSLALSVRAIWGGRLGFVPSLGGRGLQRRLFAEIMGVGLASSAVTVVGGIGTMVLTGLVGRFGTSALAGYAIGSRLENLMGAISYGIGTGMLTLIGVAAGADGWARARRVAWTGSLFAAGVIGMIGGAIALLPEQWSLLFTSDPATIAACVGYLTRAAPFYILYGLGLTLHFGSQGAGRMTVPVAAVLVRLVVTVGGGWLAIELGQGLDALFWAIGIGLAVYGVVMGGMLLLRPWQSRLPAKR
ncbi:MATE family efflux transporter [Reyranella sp.]|uniref:MATE family efflux transporter n=1 Tax=Reyranella sp. TaxID=1929291 RepID=UPI003F72137F